MSAFPIIIARIPKGQDEVRVALDSYRDALTVDIRVFSPFTPAQVPMATKKGITVGIAKLPDLASALADAETKARELGLIGGEA